MSLGLKEHHNDEFPGFSLGLIYPILGAGEDSILDTSTELDKKSLSLAKRSGKGQPKKTDDC